MQSASNLPKNASDHIPYCKDQGIPNLVAAPKRGVGMYSFTALMPADGIIALPYKMANALYQCFVANITDVADPGAVPYANRTISQITVVGPDTSDVLDILIVGQLDGQLDT